MKRKVTIQLVTVLALGMPALGQAGTSQVISPEMNNWQDLAEKSKLIRLPGGTLVSVFAYGNGRDNETVYDPKAREERPARDIWVTTSSDDGANWSIPFNLSNTAEFTSRTTAWGFDESSGLLDPASAFYGDSGNPTIFNRGNVIMITWVDKFCPADGSGGTPSASSVENVNQGAINYPERQGRQVPYACLYTAFSKSDPSVKGNWTVRQLTFGVRDAVQDVNRGFTMKDAGTGNTTGVPWVITWQEDPNGLQPGRSMGPGDGVSGAKATRGTDIWYTYVDDLRAAGAETDLLNNIQRLTQNFQTFSETEGVYEQVPLSGRPVESGNEAASRANTNLFQVPGQQKPKVVVAYEESKGAGSEEEFGKVVRYHQFDYDAPPTSTRSETFAGVAAVDPDDDITSDTVNLPDHADPARIACVISDPSKNGRRVRFFGNATNSAVGSSGAKITFLWRGGSEAHGGPADIVARTGYIGGTGSTGLRPEDLSPAVAGNCIYSLTDADRSGGVSLGDVITDNQTEINLSHQAERATQAPYTLAALQIDTEADDAEDARAHRGVMRGDVMLTGFTHTPDQTVGNHNFYVRRSFDGGLTWTSARNLSGVTGTGISVREPRIVATPGDGPTCDRGSGDTWENNPDCQNADAYAMAWVTAENGAGGEEGGTDLDIFVTGTLDSGDSYLPTAVLAGDPTAPNDPAGEPAAEPQLRVNPAGTALYAVYNGTAGDLLDASIKDHHAWFISGAALNLDPENLVNVPDRTRLADIDSDKSGSLGMVLLGMLGLLGLRRKR